MFSIGKLVLSSLYFMIQAISRSNTNDFISIHKYFGANYELKPTKAIFSQCAEKKFNEISMGQIIVKAKRKTKNKSKQAIPISQKYVFDHNRQI